MNFSILFVYTLYYNFITSTSIYQCLIKIIGFYLAAAKQLSVTRSALSKLFIYTFKPNQFILISSRVKTKRTTSIQDLWSCKQTSSHGDKWRSQFLHYYFISSSGVHKNRAIAISSFTLRIYSTQLCNKPYNRNVAEEVVKLVYVSNNSELSRNIYNWNKE